MPSAKRLKFFDEAVYRQAQVSRYASGRAKRVWSVIAAMNDGIGKHLLKKELLETKGQYADARSFIRKQCLEIRAEAFKYLEKELSGFAEEQAEWVYGNSPAALEKQNADKMINDVFYEAYSDADTVKSYATNIFNQIFQLWNARLTIAQRTGLPMKELVFQVLGKRKI